MKKTILLLFLSASCALASPISPTVTAIASPKVGQAPNVNHFASNKAAPFYRMSWRIVTVNGAAVNYLVVFAYSGQSFTTADNVFGATTYAEMKAKATALGITNLPAQTTGQP